MSQRHKFDIPVQPLSAALRQLSAQSGVRILFPYDEVATLRSRQVQGWMTTDGALGLLLAGTGLKPSETGAGVMGNGLGCIVALVAVAYVHRRPRYRTPYCLMIRKGIRYPDDVWINPATAKPLWSGPDPVKSRSLFQSRESKGGSTDMFAANFNGARMFNLNEGDETAWDGFTDEYGRNLVTWKGNRVTMGSLVDGNGLILPIERQST